MGKGACFIKAVLHMVNRFKQRKIMCSHFRLISSNEVQTVFRLSPSLFSQPCRFRRAVKSASFPPGEAKRTSADSPWCIPNGILRTAGNPSGAMRRPPLPGEVGRTGAQFQVMGEPVSVMAMKVRPWVRQSCWPSAVRKRKGLRAPSHSQRMGMSLPPLAK